MNEREALARLEKGESLASILKSGELEVHVDIGRGIVARAKPSIDEETGVVTIQGLVEQKGRGPVEVSIRCDAATAEDYVRDAVAMNLPEKALAFIQARGGSRRVYFGRRVLSSKSAPRSLGVGSKKDE